MTDRARDNRPPDGRRGRRREGGLALLRRFANDGSFALIRRLLGETGREFASRYAAVLALGIVIAVSTAFNAWIIKDVVNKIFVDRRTDMLYLLTAVVVINGFVRGASLYASSITLGRISNAVVARAQRRMFEHLLNLGVDFFNRTASSDLVTRMTHNATATQQVLDTLFTRTGRDLLTVVALVIVMFIQAPVMSLIVLVVGPITITTIGRLARRVRSVARDQFTSLGMVVSETQQTAKAVRIVKAFNMERAIQGRMDAAIDLMRKRSDKIVSIRARSSPLMEATAGLAFAVVILWAGYRAINYGEPPGRC